MTMPEITVQNAEIKTVSVTIQALTVNGKQVTLAVFRQLRQEDWKWEEICNQLKKEWGWRENKFPGIPWGTVNYHPDDCPKVARDYPHLHVVWQLNSELKRSTVYIPDSLRPSYDWEFNKRVSRLQQQNHNITLEQAQEIANQEGENIEIERGVWRELKDLPQLFIAV